MDVSSPGLVRIDRGGGVSAWDRRARRKLFSQPLSEFDLDPEPRIERDVEKIGRVLEANESDIAEARENA